MSSYLCKPQNNPERTLTRRNGTLYEQPSTGAAAGPAGPSCPRSCSRVLPPVLRGCSTRPDFEIFPIWTAFVQSRTALSQRFQGVKDIAAQKKFKKQTGLSDFRRRIEPAPPSVISTGAPDLSRAARPERSRRGEISAARRFGPRSAPERHLRSAPDQVRGYGRYDVRGERPIMTFHDIS